MDLLALQAHMPDGWAIVPQVNGVETIMDCMDSRGGSNPKARQEARRAAFTIHASYKRIEDLEQQVKDLQEALDDKVRVTREISDLIDPVANGGATLPALIDVQAQLQRDIPLMVKTLRQLENVGFDTPDVVALIARYKHL